MVCIVMLVCSPFEAAAAGQPGPLAEPAFRQDARLWDVATVGEEHAWAVGDRGTIWHTHDGGRSWQLQASSTDAELRSIVMFDRQRGIIVGSRVQPYTHRSRGVVLHTRDGGRRWRERPRLVLPGLKRIEMFDDRHGWALGDSSPLYPGGVFVTGDSGQSFQPLAAPAVTPWLCGDMAQPGVGALAGRRGTVAAVRGGELQPGPLGQFGLRNLRRMVLLPPVAGWLVGDGGLAMVTPDAGASWQTPPTPLPRAAADFDFHALAAVGDRVWLAGSPGTRVFFSHDRGESWQVASTGVTTPIHAIHFRDESHGLAVGELGTILQTDDGGQNWRVLRRGGGRTALLGIFGEPRDIPLELLVECGVDDGYLTAIELLARRDVEVLQSSAAHAEERAHQAVVAAGGCSAATAWRFPLRQAGLSLSADQLLKLWDRANDGRGTEAATRYLVRQIRMWRPEVIVTHGVSPRGDRPREHLINQLVLRAVEQAADATSHPTLTTDAGLPPWRVGKLFAVLQPGQRSAAEVSTGELVLRLGCTLAEAAADARAMVEREYRASPPTVALQLLTSRVSDERAGRDLMAGIEAPPGGDARRRLPPVTSESPDMLRRIVARRRHTQAIIERSGADPQSAANLLANSSQLIRGMDGDSAARLLFQLAERYRANGRWPLAAETYWMLADEYPESHLTTPALKWLVAYHASAEAAWRSQGGQRVESQTGRAEAAPDGTSTVGRVRHASALAMQSPEAESGPRLAADLAERLERTRPSLFADPAIRFPLAAADRRRGYPKQAERFYLSQSHRPGRDAWQTAARGELWLAEPEGEPPKPLLQCRRAAKKPRLDGQLDEAIWQGGTPARLSSLADDDRRWPAEVRLAYDDEFLYLAARCNKVPKVSYPDPPAGPRQRDTDQSARDRVEIYLDIDRDFRTWYRLTVDHRGWPSEGCWGDSSWNPRWFIAVDADEEAWTIEAAIPLEELTGRFPQPRDVWAVGIQRVAPAAGFQSWTDPAAVEVLPEGFGYLAFD